MPRVGYAKKRPIISHAWEPLIRKKEKTVFRVMKQNPDALFTHTQHGSAVKKKRTPKNANYKVMHMKIIKSHIFCL